MAKSRFEYVRTFETDDALLKNTWIVVRIDGRSFHRFTDVHKFHKPNDARAIGLMNHAAAECMREFDDIVMAYGESDEYSFVLDRRSQLFSRRASKIMTSIVSFFSSSYVLHWPVFMVDEANGVQQLQYAPQFDARCVLYPTLQNLKDYLAWRQVDCHINNLYNTTFWALVHKGGLSETAAEKRLNGTFSKDKNEILFSEFGINYNNEPAINRRGTILHWTSQEEVVVKKGVKSKTDATPVTRRITRERLVVEAIHCDLLKEEFWQLHADVFVPESAIEPASRMAQGIAKGKRKHNQVKQTKVEILEETSETTEETGTDNEGPLAKRTLDTS
eukprot:TRINITY_DN9008_c0_g1_i1.p1 TRINITY_DN9008_c0_g1~~TRINITY_DN9008_c0_g1_i1.p1  ORF type:complete len:332 (+),score=81.29 TRINITY_DN9008_c0_g1_i1:60-1055(+)